MPSFFVSLKRAGKAWLDDHASYLAAAVAYHAIFSLAPLLIVVLAIVGVLYNQGSTQEQFNQAIQSVVGRDSAELIRNMLEGSKVASQSRIALVVGTLLTIVGSIGVFGQLQQAVNLVWQVKAPKQTILGFIKRQVLLFALVIVASFLLIASLATSAIVTRWGGFFGSFIATPGWLVSLFHLVISSGMMVVLFAVLFKVLPEAKIRWKHVWVPALVTMILFTIGKYLLGLYLGRGATTSPYGAAGSFVGLLIWIFYAAQIFLFGVELVKTSQGSDGTTSLSAIANNDASSEPNVTREPAAHAHSPLFVGGLVLGTMIGFFARRSLKKDKQLFN